MRARTLRHQMLALCLIASATPLAAQTQAAAPTTPPPAAEDLAIGVQGLGFAGLDWPSAKQSFEATGLAKRPFEFGGSVRATNLWRTLFVEVHASKWSTTGERAFVDSTGTVHPLGIPLDVHATHVDVTAGWRFIPQARTSIRTAIPYIGAGAGRVSYREQSPFAEAADDLETSTTSYHVALGADFPLNRWLGIATDLRYRFTPDVLGEDGVSSAFEEDDLGGFQLAVGIRVGFGVAAPPRLRPAERATEPEPLRDVIKPAAPGINLRSGAITAAAPVYLRPDPSRVPLRVLDAGTPVTILDESQGWLHIEFRDPQFGTRIGYVESKFVRR